MAELTILKWALREDHSFQQIALAKMGLFTGQAWF
jgi:hypothetical protein